MPEDKLQKYEKLINELKDDLGDPVFDQLFAQKTASLSKPDQFLLKMEMSRLSQPIARFIDLRGQVDGEVKPYEHAGKQHFMDDVAVEVFEREIARHGKYTLAVYESVMQTENNFKVLQKKAKEREEEIEQENESHQFARLVRFASYEFRTEERMNYSIKITVELSPNSEKIAASTSDISLSGAKIKMPTKYPLVSGQCLSIRLVGLEQDFELGLKDGIQYEVVAVEPVSREYTHIRLKRTFVENTPGFDEFLESFIHGNKRRYKINLDNTLDAVVCKGHEQFYLPRVNSLFVFFSQKQNMLFPSMVLTNENNAHVKNYFEDERKVSCLYGIFHQKRLKQILTQSTPVKECYFYSFTHISGGKIYYYSAFDFEFNKNQELKSLFCGFGSQKDSWRSFKVQFMPSHHEDAFIPLSLPASAGKNVGKLNKRPTPRVQGFIQDVKFLMLLTEITTPISVEHFKLMDFDSSMVSNLKHFGHGRSKNPPPLEVVSLEYVNLRAHKRYLYKTTVTLKLEHPEPIKAHTRDFSEKGLQIETSIPVPLEKGSIVQIDLPDLQKITKQHDLRQLKYEVMAVSKSKTIINLKIHQLTDLPHPAVQFFKVLIANNKNKLHACEEAPKVPGLSLALRNMVTKSVCQTPLYLEKEAAHFDIGAVGQGLYASSLHKVLHSFKHTHENEIDVTNVLPDGFAENRLSEDLRNLSRQDKPKKYLLLVRFDPDKPEPKQAIKSQCIHLEDSMDSLYLFIKKAVKHDMLFVYHLHVSKTGRPDMDYLANELRYVSHYAIHKAKDLEESLWTIAGVCDLIDVTEHVLNYLDLDRRLIDSMSERKNDWFKRSL